VSIRTRHRNRSLPAGDLIGRYTTLEEVRELLNVLKLHEGKWVAGVVTIGNPNIAEPLIRDVIRDTAGIVAALDRPRLLRGTSSANAVSHSTASSIIVRTLCSPPSIEKLRLLASDGFEHCEPNAMCALSSRDTQLVPAARPGSKPRERKK